MTDAQTAAYNNELAKIEAEDAMKHSAMIAAFWYGENHARAVWTGDGDEDWINGFRKIHSAFEHYGYNTQLVLDSFNRGYDAQMKAMGNRK